jgi:hypothetical protein
VKREEHDAYIGLLGVYMIWVGYGQHVKDRSMGMDGEAALWEIVWTVRDAGTGKCRGLLTDNDL